MFHFFFFYKKYLLLLVLAGLSISGKAQDKILIMINVQAKTLQNPTNLGLRGSLSPLSWEKTYPLTATAEPGMYATTLEIDKHKGGEMLEYKIVYGKEKVTYELESGNRILILNKDSIWEKITWNVANPIDKNTIPKIAPEKLLEDLALFKRALSEIHPGLNRYLTEKQTDSLWQDAARKFSDSLSYAEAFLVFTQITSSIQCGHTFPSFYNQSGFIEQVVLNGKDKLPFIFRVVDKRMIVTGNASEIREVGTGAEIVAINDIPVSEILAKIAPLVKADGNNDAKRYADLNTFGIGKNEMFDAYFPLLFPANRASYKITYLRMESSTLQTGLVTPVTRSERMQKLKERGMEPSAATDNLWELAFWENQTAYLRLSTFDVFSLNFEWKEFLKDTFREIKKKKVQNLVIDIRWNEGGQDEILYVLGQFMTRKSIEPVVREERVRFQRINEDLKPYLFTWDKSFFDMGDKVVKGAGNYYTFKEPEPLKFYPDKNAFDGKVYLLVNAANSSATFYFAELAKKNQLATLVGETTGGNQKGLNAGGIFFLRLPHSKIEIDIPIFGTFSTEKPGTGIAPDYEVPETAEDIRKGKDPVIGFTKKMIAGQ